MREARELLQRMRELRREARPAAIVSILAVEGSAYRREGARLLVEPDGALTGVLSGGCVERELLSPARAVLADARARTLRFDLTADEEAIWGFGLGCSGTLTLLIEPLAGAGELVERALGLAIDERRAVVLATRVAPAPRGDGTVEVDRELSFAETAPGATAASVAGGFELREQLLPPVHLVVIGAERDVVPLLRLAGELGWQATVVDARPTPESEARIAPYARYLAAAPRQLGAALALDARSAVLVATHRYLDDLAFLGELAAAPIGYLGLLGPAARRQRLLADLARQRGAAAAPLAARGPAGLDLGGRSPQEIALAVAAEIQAALHGGSGQPLATKGARAEREAIGPRR